MKGRHRFIALLTVLAAVAVPLAAVASARTRSAPPVGPLPGGPTSTIQTQVGQLVAFARLTRGERTKAYESRRFVVNVR